MKVSAEFNMVTTKPMFGAIYKNIDLPHPIGSLIPNPGDMLVTDHKIACKSVNPYQTVDNARIDGIQFKIKFNRSSVSEEQIAQIHTQEETIAGANKVGFQRIDELNIQALTDADLDQAIDKAWDEDKALHLWA